MKLFKFFFYYSIVFLSNCNVSSFLVRQLKNICFMLMYRINFFLQIIDKANQQLITLMQTNQKPPLLSTLPCKYNLALGVLINLFFNSYTFLKGKVSVLLQSARFPVTLSGKDWKHCIAFLCQLLLKNNYIIES